MELRVHPKMKWEGYSNWPHHGAAPMAAVTSFLPGKTVP